jgi:6-phosphogluconolactonase/glucosamine-6-phosphate isomerase/deaminase
MEFHMKPPPQGPGCLKSGAKVALLGIGLNAHLGLNEPGGALVGPAHVATLEPGTANHRCFTGVITFFEK